MPDWFYLVALNSWLCTWRRSIARAAAASTGGLLSRRRWGWGGCNTLGLALVWGVRRGPAALRALHKQHCKGEKTIVPDLEAECITTPCTGIELLYIIALNASYAGSLHAVCKACVEWPWCLKPESMFAYVMALSGLPVRRRLLASGQACSTAFAQMLKALAMFCMDRIWHQADAGQAPLFELQQ